jgi:hypothetical protein
MRPAVLCEWVTNHPFFFFLKSMKGCVVLGATFVFEVDCDLSGELGFCVTGTCNFKPPREPNDPIRINCTTKPNLQQNFIASLSNLYLKLIRWW